MQRPGSTTVLWLLRRMDGEVMSVAVTAIDSEMRSPMSTRG
jgi:hypothetical protein